MAFPLPLSSQRERPAISLKSDFLPPVHLIKPINVNRNYSINRNYKSLSITVARLSLKTVRDPSLDRHVVKQNKVRFVQKLKTLLLSKPKHYMPLHVLSKCRSYLSLMQPRSLLSMIHRYPSIFELFTIPTPRTPLNATKSGSQLCVRLTPAAAALATQEYILKSKVSMTLAMKLQKLLMLSSHHQLLLSKLVHIAPDLGLPPNFRSQLCSDHPNKFKIVDTSYGRALKLVSYDPQLANPLPSSDVKSEFIVDRPLKFKHLRLRKGMNVKRHQREFLIKFGELPDVCPYKTPMEKLAKESIEAEKRACSLVREVLGMMVEKRTLVDHLTHFRKDFGLPNKLRGMLARHPELFYLSLKGQRDSVFLVEGYDDKGELVEKDEILAIKHQLMELVREAKRMRRQRRNGRRNNGVDMEVDNSGDVYDDDDSDDNYDDFDDGLNNLFESEDSGSDDGSEETTEFLGLQKKQEFWNAEAAFVANKEANTDLQPW